MILKAIFEQSLRDDDDESRVKRSIHRVVRVKENTARTLFTILGFVQLEQRLFKDATPPFCVLISILRAGLLITYLSNTFTMTEGIGWSEIGRSYREEYLLQASVHDRTILRASTKLTVSKGKNARPGEGGIVVANGYKVL